MSKRVFAVLMMVLACGAAQAGTLSIETSGITTNLRCVDVLDENFAIAQGGSSILKYDGTTWSNFTPAPVWTGADYWGVKIVSATDIWIGDYVNAGNEFGHFDGTAWINSYLPFDIAGGNWRVYTMWADNSGFLVMGTNLGIAVLDSGYDWSGSRGVATRPVTTLAYADVDASSANNIWAVTSGSVLVSNNRGVTWTSRPVTGFETGNFSGVSVLNDNSAWLSISSLSPSKVFHWNGTSYQTYSVPGISWINSIYAASDTDVWVCGTGAIAHFDGSFWAILDVSSIGVAAGEILNHISGAGNKVFAVGNGGRIIKATYDANPWPVGCAPFKAGDLTGDCSVDFEDFAKLAEDWLSCANSNDPACN